MATGEKSPARERWIETIREREAWREGDSKRKRGKLKIWPIITRNRKDRPLHANRLWKDKLSQVRESLGALVQNISSYQVVLLYLRRGDLEGGKKRKKKGWGKTSIKRLCVQNGADRDLNLPV